MDSWGNFTRLLKGRIFKRPHRRCCVDSGGGAGPVFVFGLLGDDVKRGGNVLGQQGQHPQGRIVVVMVAGASVQARHSLLACLSLTTRGGNVGQQGQRPNGRTVVRAAHRGRGCSPGRGHALPT